MRSRRATPNDGFTLIEALVAFAIVAIASIVLQRGLVQSRLGLAAAADREAAEWVARDLLATPLTLAEMQSGGRTGTANGRRFEIRLTPLDLAAVDEAAPAADAAGPGAAGRAEPSLRWIPMRERIVVAIGGGNSIAIETVKLGPVERNK